MDGLCFIRPCGSDLKLHLVKAINIPIAPQKYHFSHCGEILTYTLYFPGLPENTRSIDIIENTLPGNDWFNFFGVSIDTVKNEKINVNNSMK